MKKCITSIFPNLARRINGLYKIIDEIKLKCPKKQKS